MVVKTSKFYFQFIMRNLKIVYISFLLNVIYCSNLFSTVKLAKQNFWKIKFSSKWENENNKYSPK
jgi:hypothetical protein